MHVEENCTSVEVSSKRSKLSHKIELYLTKIIPIILAFGHWLNTILSYFNIDLIILSYLCSCSLLPLIYIWYSSKVFKFCEYHRIPLYYILANNIICWYNYTYRIPINDFNYVIFHAILVGIAIFITLYLKFGR